MWLSSYRLNSARIKVSSGPKCRVNTLLVQMYDVYLKAHLWMVNRIFLVPVPTRLKPLWKIWDTAEFGQ